MAQNYINKTQIKVGNNTSTYIVEPTLYSAASTSDSGGAYTATLDNFGLTTGATVQIKFAATNKASATLNVNSTGAKTIFYNNAAIVANTLKANHTYTLVYDGTQWQLVGDIDTNTWRGIQDNLTSSTNTTESLSAKQGYLLANGSARDNTKLEKITYEYNKEIAFGSSGKLLIGKFPCYDSNVTIQIFSTTNITYHATAILATQNINTTGGGTITWRTYGDSANTVTPNLYAKYASGSRNIEIYFSPSNWSKNYIHIACVALWSAPTNICENITSIPSDATLQPTNTLLSISTTGDAGTVNGHTVLSDVPANAVFTDTNKYHKTGSWNGLTYTATAVNSADELKFTIPNKIQTNWELNATSGNSPALLFTRDGSLTDWKLFVTAGKLSFASATDASTWTERAYFKDNSGDFVANSFTGNGSALTSLNASNLASGTVPSARLPVATSSALGAVKIGSGVTITDGVISVTASDLGLASALKYVGAKSSLPTATDSTTYSTYNNGDVITVSNKEYAYVKGSNAAGSSWVELGDEGSYKLKQTAITNSTGSADGTNTATTFIYSFSQDAQGVVSVKTRNLPTYNNYSHPTGDGNLHVPATGTSNNGKFLKAGSTAGSISWAALTASDLPSHTHFNLVTIGDQRSTATTPNDYNNKLIFAGLKTTATINNPSTNTYSYVVGLRGWGDSSGGKAHEFAFNDNGINWRTGSTTTWGDWYLLAHSGNIETGDSNGQIKIAGINVDVKGLGSAAYTASSDYAISGHSHTLKIGNKSLSVSTSEQTWDLHDILKSSTNIGVDTSWQIYTPGVYYVAAGSAFTGEKNPESTNGGLEPYRYGQLIVTRAGTGGVAQFYIAHSASSTGNGLKFRSGWNNTYVDTWRSILDNSNYTNYTVKKDGTGASGTWGISVTGSSASCTGNAATATAIQTAGTAAQFYRGDNTWSNTISGGLFKITNNGNTVTIGSANSSWCHIENSANIPFYFNRDIQVSGIFKIYNKNTSLSNDNLTFNSGGGWYMKDTTWIRTVGSRSVYMNTGTFRCDGTIQSRTFQHVNANIVADGSWTTEATGTNGDGTNAGTTGTSILSIGNVTAVTKNNGQGQNNSRGYLRIYSDGTDYGALTGYTTFARTHIHASTGISFPENIINIMFRPGASSYYTHISYQTYGNEALVAATQNAVTSFIFVNGESYENVTSDRWTKITPAVQIKQNSVYIGELIAHNVAPTYKFKVTGESMFKGKVYLGDRTGYAFPSSGIHVWDTRSADFQPGALGKSVNFFFTNTPTPTTSWCGGIYVRGWDGSNYAAWCLVGPATDGDQSTAPLYVRSSQNATTWGSYRKIYDTSNPPTYSEVGAPSKTGTNASGTWNISISGNATTASKIAAKLASTTKTFLLGTSTTITGTAANVDLIGDTGVYLTTTAGQLSAKSYSINDGTNEKVRLEWNATDQSLDFIFA